MMEEEKSVRVNEERQGYENEPNDVHVHSQKLINYVLLEQT
jgi:hypothetical protein